MRTVASADQIVVIKDGSIEELGRPNKLEEQNGLFASMLRTQLQSLRAD